MNSHDKTLGPIFCSIGENCLGQGLLDRHELQSCLTPFSWGRSNIDYVLQIIDEQFADFLNPKFLQHRERYGKMIVTNSKYSCASGVFDASVASEFEFTHHDVINVSEELASMQRKVDRFLELLKSNRKIVFLYHYRHLPTGNQETTYVLDRLNLFHSSIKSFRRAPSKLICFTQDIIASTANRHMTVEQYGTCTFASLHTHRVWGGSDPDVFWGKVDDDLFAQLLFGSDVSAALP